MRRNRIEEIDIFGFYVTDESKMEITDYLEESNEEL